MRWLGALGRGLGRRMAWGCVVLVWGCLLLPIGGCAKEPPPLATATPPKPNQGRVVGAIDEVAPPSIVQRLNRELDRYQPQVQIIAPRPDETLMQTQVAVQLRVQDLPLFKDEVLAAGPHLKLMLDDRPVTEIFDVTDPITISDLTPGTHTLRAFAERPWHESFKNDGAYAQVSFHVFAKTQTQVPDSGRPLLTYNQPIGTVGTEPVLLDFYLTNAPLHLLARERDDDEIVDWKVRVTVNGDSFLLDDWQSIYLKGFRRGKNWVKLELIDDRGELLENAFNESVALVEFDPKQSSTIDRLIKGDLPETEARALIDPNYEPPAPEPEPIPEPPPEPVELIAPEPEPVPAPTEAAPEVPAASAPAAAVESPTEPETLPEPEPMVEPEPAIAPEPAVETVAEPEADGDDALVPAEPSEAIDEASPAATSEPVEAPVATETPITEPASDQLEAAQDPTPDLNSQPTSDQPEPIASPEPAPAVESEPVAEPEAVKEIEPIASPEPAPAPVEPAIAPVAAPIVEPEIEPAPQPSAVTEPTQPAKKPLSGTRKQVLKWLKQAQQSLPDDLNLPFDIKQVPIPSGD